MALLDVFKKKSKPKQMDLPPPPMPHPSEPPATQAPEFPELPPLPEEEQHIPSITSENVPPPPKQEHTEELPAMEAPKETPAKAPAPMAQEEPHEMTPPVHELPQQPPAESPPAMHKVPHKELEEIEKPEPSYAPPPREIVKPVFVNVADYEDIMNGIEKVRVTLSDSEDLIGKLTDLKNAEDKVFEDWRTHVEDIERKLTYIDQVIFRGE